MNEQQNECTSSITSINRYFSKMMSFESLTHFPFQLLTVKSWSIRANKYAWILSFTNQVNSTFEHLLVIVEF